MTQCDSRASNQTIARSMHRLSLAFDAIAPGALLIVSDPVERRGAR